MYRGNRGYCTIRATTKGPLSTLCRIDRSINLRTAIAQVQHKMVELSRLPSKKRRRSPDSEALKAATLDRNRRKAKKSKHINDSGRSFSVRNDRQSSAPAKKLPESAKDSISVVDRGSEKDDDSVDLCPVEEVRGESSKQRSQQPKKNKSPVGTFGGGLQSRPKRYRRPRKAIVRRIGNPIMTTTGPIMKKEKRSVSYAQRSNQRRK